MFEKKLEKVRAFLMNRKRKINRKYMQKYKDVIEFD